MSFIVILTAGPSFPFPKITHSHSFPCTKPSRSVNAFISFEGVWPEHLAARHIVNMGII
jgi:hypothetical protein